ncbi:MAG: hypothetical protein I8H66_09620 [Sphingobacteriia bacterium]|nr:hypothetical protein [Sphingobacteriia bacterium]
MKTYPDTALLIYADVLHPRLEYIVATIFPFDAALTDSMETLLAYNGPKMNYSVQQSNEMVLRIVPHGLLAEEGIGPQQIECFEWQGLKVFFPTPGDLPFDFLAASFYLISRYEEYFPPTKDAFGRYAHENSLAYRENFLHQPLVQLWVQQITKHCFNAGLNKPLTAYKPPFSFIPTYDIDIAYSYLHHSTFRNAAGFFRDFMQGKMQLTTERLQVLSGMQKDPYDVYEWLDLLHNSLQLKPLYFFLLAKQRKGPDKNLHPGQEVFKQLIRHHAALYTTGIHPSVQSNSNPALLQEETGTLRSITGKAITVSRQHYIQLELPVTYQRLQAVGIQQDYSMGYPAVNGFRASYAAPFYWFDLSLNKTTALEIHPFCYMDATAIFQERSDTVKAADDLQYYFDTVKATGGECITIFHNNFLTKQAAFAGWRKMYADFLLHNLTH